MTSYSVVQTRPPNGDMVGPFHLSNKGRKLWVTGDPRSALLSRERSLEQRAHRDDDESTVDAFARMLRLEGYQVLTAANAEAGFRQVETSHPDVILLDLRMPITGGIAFLRRLRAHEKHGRTPVAVITGDYALEDTLSGELRELDADVYFKPVWLDDLLGITQRLLQRKG